MTPTPIPVPRFAELPVQPCVFYTACESYLKAAAEFEEHYREEPRAIYSVINPLTGHTTYCIPQTNSDKREIYDS
jgi:hypothetical protein